ncbi:MAG: D-glycerate dehydrogenase [Rhodospirillales bacterium CG15_BIG_FIL_POST_REV_8_21_14_020_66_15]|nr:MAG: D-glycerate dehydrogenase [Rhodospirillales bacterium CG15_BIG_FIL_POST_REV_8_21_14_020_66_15]
MADATSGKPTVLVTRRLPDAVHDRLMRDYDARLNPEDRLYTKDALIRAAEGADAILPCHTEHFTEEVFASLPKSVRIIANFSVGYDHVDVAAAKKHGVVVTNTPEVLSDATAETTILLMLGAARRAGEGERLVRSGGWKDWSPAFMVGRAVTGKRLGILGMGRVGQAVADLARAFRMEIHYHNRARLSPDKEQGAVWHDSLNDMLPHCDFLSLHCNVTEETRGIMNAARFALLPDGAVLVNAARGAVVDDDALVDALESGKLFAAGIDAYNNEPNVDKRLIALDNTFLLPHVGSANRETRDAMGFRALDNLDAFFAGREPGDRVA